MFRITCRSIGSSIKRYGSFETNGIIRSCSVVRFGSNDASKTTLDYFHILGIDVSIYLVPNCFCVLQNPYPCTKLFIFIIYRDHSPYQQMNLNQSIKD